MHPLRNDRTVELAPADLVSFVKAWKHEPKVVDFGDDSPAQTTAAAPSKPAKPAKAAAKAASAPPPQDAGRKSGADAKGLEFTKAGNFPRWYEQVRATVSWVGNAQSDLGVRPASALVPHAAGR